MVRSCARHPQRLRKKLTGARRARSRRRWSASRPRLGSRGAPAGRARFERGRYAARAARARRFVIIDNKGQILRKHPDMSKEKAEQYGTLVKRIADKARHVVRDLEPEVRRAFLQPSAAPVTPFTPLRTERFEFHQDQGPEARDPRCPRCGAAGRDRRDRRSSPRLPRAPAGENYLVVVVQEWTPSS